MNYSHEFLGEYEYFIIPSEDYDAVPEGTNLKFEGIIEKKPIIKHLRSKNLREFRSSVISYRRS